MFGENLDSSMYVYDIEINKQSVILFERKQMKFSTINCYSMQLIYEELGPCIDVTLFQNAALEFAN